MQFCSDLDPGFWLVKWIDHFFLRTGDASSATVDIFLQKLNFGDEQLRKGLSKEFITDLIRTTTATGSDNSRLVYKKTILAGDLPHLRIGQVLTSGGRAGYIPIEQRTVTLTRASKIRACTKSDLRFPSGVSSGEGDPTTETLEPEEYTIGYRSTAKKSRLLVFEDGGVEYILPRIVIFQAFYALSSKIANAFSNGPWSYTARDVISFAHFQSGLATKIDPLTADWKIVLALGTQSDHAPQLALLWFDKFARRCADAIHTDAAIQNGSKSPGASWRWYANAAIPHTFDRPFHMRVHGYSLHPISPGKTGGSIKRFLITSITASSWSRPDQVIAWASFTDNSAGLDRRPAEAGERYMSHAKIPVEGDRNAVASAYSDPNNAESVNLFTESTFTFLDDIKLEKQEKQSSKIYETEDDEIEVEEMGGIPRQDGPAGIVSTGNLGGTTDTPAPADIRNLVRDALKQFEFLTAALHELSMDGRLSYSVVGPAYGNNLLQIRNGYSCWSLIKPTDRNVGRIPRKGWVVIKSSMNGSEDGGRGGRATNRRQTFPRTVLLCEILIGDKRLVLIDIEPRSSSEGFCLVAFQTQQAISAENIEPVLAAIRGNEGRFKIDTLDEAFSTIAESPVATIDHRYEYEAGDGPDQKIARALNSRFLFERLMRVAAFGS